MRYRVFLLVLAISASWLNQPNRAYGGGFTPDITSMAPGMVGVGDQGDAVEMGQRLGKFMGSFMREMKTTPERMDANEQQSSRNTRQSYRSSPERNEYSQDDEQNFNYESKRNRNESNTQSRNNSTPQYLPLYDPWGVEDRGNPLLDHDTWGSRYDRPYSPYGPSSERRSDGYVDGYRSTGPYGRAADFNWDRGRNYYGAGLAPWENSEPMYNSRDERRWHDPSYYEPDYNPRYWDHREGPYGPPRNPSPWSEPGAERYKQDNWW